MNQGWEKNGVFVVVPAWNEAKNISVVLSDLKKYYPADNIVVVDDGSADETYNLALANGVAVLRHPLNRGQGAALQTGTDYALSRGAEIIVHFDADGQHQAEEIAEWIKPVAAGEVEVVLGSRFLGKTAKNLPLSKKIFFKLIIPWHNLFTGLKLTDLHNGTRVLSRRAAEKIRITQDEMAHNSEIQSQIAKFRLPYREVPVEIIYNRYGRGAKTAMKILKDLIKKSLVG
ncbi:MAG: glycosyltransferase family 2 protein [Patescibacteria group bacterium]|jgi:glycosyltransferase involved in cell wall biosynthesis